VVKYLYCDNITVTVHAQLQMTVISIQIICDQFSAKTISPELAAQARHI
jgi:hypothetical protein